MKCRYLIFLLALVLGFATAVWGQESPAQNGQPKLVIEAFAHDFGEVKPGAPLQFSFIIKNQGKADLLIKSVAPG
jgi:hypothetical protein